MKTIARLACALLLCAAASAEAAAPKISVLRFTGPKAATPHGQLEDLLCGTYECVSPAKLTRRGRPDWAKVRAAGVDWILTGKVTGPRAKRVLTVELFDAQGVRQWRQPVALARNGKLMRSGAEKLLRQIEETVRPPEPAPPPPPAETPPSPPERKPEVVESERAQQPPPPEEPPAPSGAALTPRPLVVAEAGVAGVYRNYRYLGLTTGNLRAYETAPLFFAPRLHLELYPLARAVSGLAQGLGVEAGYAFAVGLRSVDENGVAYATSVSQVDVAARLQLWPAEGLPLKLAPVAGYRWASFLVGASKDGARLKGMPGIRYGGLLLGVDGEYSVSDSVPVFARLAWVPLFGLGELGQQTFPEHGGFGVEARVGVGYRIVAGLQLRLEAHYTQYRLSFRTEKGAPFLATGAVDQYAGGAALVRYTY